jgi:hypothetical protein
MSILVKHVEFVNDQIVFHTKMAEKPDIKPFAKKLHITTKEKFEALSADLVEADKMLDREPIDAQKTQPSFVRLSLTPDDLDGLPEELLKELSADTDHTDFAILNVVENAGGIISLDKLLIGLYKKTGQVHKRQSLTSRLYRMAQNKLIFSVPTKKGVYSSHPMTEEQASSLLGGYSRETD